MNWTLILYVLVIIAYVIIMTLVGIDFRNRGITSRFHKTFDKIVDAINSNTNNPTITRSPTSSNEQITARQVSNNSSTLGPKMDIPVYVINLKRSTDRWTSFENEMKNINFTNYTRIDAVDGKQITNRSGGSVNDIEFINDFENGSISELACTLSHLKTIKQAYSDGLEHALILEDDVLTTLVPFWTFSLTDIIKSIDQKHPDWHTLSLFNLQVKSMKVGQFEPTQPYTGTGAYIINKRGMKTIMDKSYVDNSFKISSQWCDAPIADKYIYALCEFASYTLSRPLFIGADFSSTIGCNGHRLGSNTVSTRIMTAYLEDFNDAKKKHVAL